MNVFAYASVLLAKSQTAFALAANAGVEVPSALSSTVASLQKAVNTAEGFEVPAAGNGFVTEAENFLTTSLANDTHLNAVTKGAIADAVAIVQNKGAFNVSFDFAAPKPTVELTTPGAAPIEATL